MLALENLPKGLYEIFSRMIKRVLARDHVKQTIKLLQISSVAKRALTIEELREAVTLEPYQRSLVTQNLPNDMDVVLRSCCGFVFTDEEEQTVHFIHHSVKKFLFSKDTGMHNCAFNQSELDRSVGLLCMTYLNLDNFQRQLAKAETTIHSNVDPKRIAELILPKDSIRKKLALLLLSGEHQSKPKTMYDLKRQFEDISAWNHYSDLQDETMNSRFRFLTYAKTYWIYHLQLLNETLDKKCWNLFCRCVQGTDTMIERPWKSFEESGAFQLEWLSKTLSKWIWKNSHCALLKCIINSETNTISTADTNEMFLESVASGKIEFVEILLKSKIIQVPELNRALVNAAGDGYIKMVETLLDAGADVNITAKNGQTVLYAAAEGGHIEVVECLLRTAGINVNAVVLFGTHWSALAVAAGGGHIEVVKALLAAGATDISQYMPTALVSAAEGGHTNIVRVLIDAGDYVTSAIGLEALTTVMEGGHLSTTKVLKSAIKRRFLEAVNAGNVQLVGGLLKAGVNFNFVLDGETALQMAVHNGDTTMVSMLLAAAEAGHIEVVKTLLAAGADVNAAASIGSGYQTALQAAASKGHDEIAKILLAAGADVNAPDFNG